MTTRFRVSLLLLFPLLFAASACEIVTSELSAQETAEWRKRYDLQPGGRVEIRNVNGRISVEPSSGETVEVTALKRARGASPDAARQLLDRIVIEENISADSVRIDTRLPRSSGFFGSGGGEVQYTVKMPAAAAARLVTVNGGIEIEGLNGLVEASTTNGAIRARELGGAVSASTTNGAVEVDLVRLAEDGATFSTTNGAVTVRIPRGARADVSASVTNGGIETDGLSLEVTESSRRTLEGRLNGGGPQIRATTTNGGIRLASR